MAAYHGVGARPPRVDVRRGQQEAQLKVSNMENRAACQQQLRVRLEGILACITSALAYCTPELGLHLDRVCGGGVHSSGQGLQEPGQVGRHRLLAQARHQGCAPCS